MSCISGCCVSDSGDADYNVNYLKVLGMHRLSYEKRVNNEAVGKILTAPA